MGICIALTWLPGATLAGTTNTDIAIPDQAVSSAPAERAQQAVAAGGDAIARWLDAFFDEPNSTVEQATSRIELRQSATFSHRDDSDYRARVSAKVNLPSLSKKLSFTFQGTEDETELENGAAQEFTNNEDDALESPALGVQYIFGKHNGYYGSFSVGTRLDNPSINFGPRFRYQHALSEHWRGRYTQRLLWDTDDGWESLSKAEFDRPLASGHLFRQSFRADWQESKRDRQGIRYTLKSAYVRRLEADSAISYEVASRYTTKPRMSWTQHVALVRYRRSFWRPWMFIEASPFVSFAKEFNWHPNPGIRLSLDIVFAQSRTPDVTDETNTTEEI